MSFIQREIDRIRTALLDPANAGESYERLYVAQQALAWATDPEGFKSPYSAVMGTQEGSEDYSGNPRPSQS